jgi:hypothetical protein
LILADFHNHTRFSPDSQTAPKTLIERLVDHPSIKVAAVTDHNTVDRLEIVRHLAVPHSDILICSGVEITTNQGDTVLLGAEELPPRPWTVDKIVDFAKETSCGSVVVHPFREFGLGEVAGTCGVDAIEVLNGCSSAAANGRHVTYPINLVCPEWLAVIPMILRSCFQFGLRCRLAWIWTKS